MRLTEEAVTTLKSALKREDPQAKLYLYGSRVDDTKRGGDIDLLIISKVLERAAISRIRWAFYEKFGEQKMDILIDDGSLGSAFVKKVMKEAVQL